MGRKWILFSMHYSEEDRQEAYFIFSQFSSYLLNPHTVLEIEAHSAESSKIAH